MSVRQAASLQVTMQAGPDTILWACYTAYRGEVAQVGQVGGGSAYSGNGDAQWGQGWWQQGGVWRVGETSGGGRGWGTVEDGRG